MNHLMMQNLDAHVDKLELSEVHIWYYYGKLISKILLEKLVSTYF